MRFLNITCEDTSPLISEMMDHKVSLFRRLKVKFHLDLCEACLRYKKQLEIIKDLSHHLSREDFPVNEKEMLSPEAKEKIQKMIETKK